MESVCIVGGTGALGFGLALRLGVAGVPVVIGSRDAERAQEAADRARAAVPAGSFTGTQNQEGTQAADLVVLCVPFRNQSENLTNLKPVLSAGQVLVDATVPLAAAVSGKATRTLGVWQGSAAQQAQEMVPDGVRVISALHTVSAALLADLDHALDEDVLICGDDPAAKDRVAELVRAIDGLRPVDCGALEMARFVEQLTPLIISINVRHKIASGHQDHGPLNRPVVVLAGGTGGAKLARGMLDVVGGEDLVVIANTGDDVEIHGGYVSPDPDLVTFWLADQIDDRGWGLAGDTFSVMDALRDLGHEVWFNLGDRDLAIALERARRLGAGERLTDVQKDLGRPPGGRGPRCSRWPTLRSGPGFWPADAGGPFRSS